MVTVEMILLLALPVTLTSPLSDQQVNEEETATFTCTLSQPGQKVEWFFGEETIKLNDSHYKISSNDKTYTLQVNKSVLKDIGDYTLKCGDVTTTALLDVIGKACRYFIAGYNIVINNMIVD